MPDLEKIAKKNHYKMELIRTVIPCILLVLQSIMLLHMFKVI